MNLNEAKTILKRTGYSVINESAVYDNVLQYFNGTSFNGNKIKFIAEYMSEDGGEPDEEEIMANSWSAALRTALGKCDEYAMLLVGLKFAPEYVDALAEYED